MRTGLGESGAFPTSSLCGCRPVPAPGALRPRGWRPRTPPEATTKYDRLKLGEGSEARPGRGEGGGGRRPLSCSWDVRSWFSRRFRVPVAGPGARVRPQPQPSAARAEAAASSPSSSSPSPSSSSTKRRRSPPPAAVQCPPAAGPRIPFSRRGPRCVLAETCGGPSGFGRPGGSGKGRAETGCGLPGGRPCGLGEETTEAERPLGALRGTRGCGRNRLAEVRVSSTKRCVRRSPVAQGGHAPSCTPGSCRRPSVALRTRRRPSDVAPFVGQVLFGTLPAGHRTPGA